MMSIRAPSHEQPAARSSRADSASRSPSAARPIIGSRQRQGWVKDVVSAQRCGAETAAQQAGREGPLQGDNATM